MSHNGQYKIERHVPYTTLVIHRYPFARMKVGDSFVIPYDQVVASTRSALHSSAKSRDMRTSVRQLADKSLRVWRVK